MAPTLMAPTLMAPTLSTVTGDHAPRPETEADPESLVDEELLVEEISIDGMCGVY